MFPGNFNYAFCVFTFCTCTCDTSCCRNLQGNQQNTIRTFKFTCDCQSHAVKSFSTMSNMEIFSYSTVAHILMWYLQRLKSCNVKSCRGFFCRKTRSEISEYKWMSRQKQHHKLSTKLHSSKWGRLSRRTGNNLNPFIVTHSQSSSQLLCIVFFSPSSSMIFFFL